MKTVVIFGGSGFVGRHIIRRLAKKGYKLIIPYQILPDLPKLRILGNVGQIIPIRFKNLEDDIIIKSINNADAIINLKTIWDEGNISFENGILKFNRELIDIIKIKNTLASYIFFSGLGVDESSLSQRIKNIAKSENYILKNFHNSIILRPGIILGGNDNFLGRLIPIMKFSPFIPLFGGGNSNIQPVFIDDVAKAVELLLEKQNYNKSKKIYEIYGREIFTYSSLYLLIGNFLNIKRIYFFFPFSLAKIFFKILRIFGIKILTNEQLELFKNDNLPTKEHLSLHTLGINPNNVSAVIKNSIKKYL
tara:strand:- start:4482 stop:5399 length:918 start_codon:yes stop_codon:yes gene_type:complete